MAKDYYKTLGLGKDAAPEEIKRAYRDLALKVHPDRNKDPKAEAMMRDINEAYAVLSDPEKRKQYDTYGADTFNQRFTQEDIFRGANFEDIFKNMGANFGNEDIFNIFGGGFGSMGRSADVGNDILTNVTISLHDAAKGVKRNLNISHVKECERCSGSGAEPGSRVIKCPVCNGAGQMKETRRTPFGIMQTITACQRCGGAGKSAEKQCSRCRGGGRVHTEEKVEVEIPRGVSDGMRLRLTGMGDFGRDRTGDLYIDVAVQGDRTFERSGDNIIIEMHIPLHIALLGGEITVPSLDGERKLRIDEGTQNGARIRIDDAGIPHMKGGGQGDELVNITVDIPKRLSEEQKDLVRKLAGTGEGDGKKRKFGVF